MEGDGDGYSDRSSTKNNRTPTAKRAPAINSN